MRTVFAASMTLVLVGCASVPETPALHPLTQARIHAMGPTPFSVTENYNGLEKSWTYTHAANAGTGGIAGAIGAAIAEAIINWGPSRRAQKSADELGELVTPETLNADQVARLRQLVAASPPPGISMSQLVATQKLIKPEPLDDTVEIESAYTISEDATVLRVMTKVSYADAKNPFVSPYPKAKPVKNAPVYFNTFTYYSTPLPLPENTPELADRLVTSIQDSARDAAGALPAEGSKEFKAMQKEITDARDGKLSKAEASIFMAREWTKDNGARIRQEVARANDFVAKYVLIDLNRTAVPTIDGVDEHLETADDKRTVRRVGSGAAAGSYISSAGDVSTFATYGNSIAVAAYNRERISTLKKQGK